MRRATVLLAVACVAAGGFADALAGTGHGSVPVLMPPVEVVNVEVYDRTVGVAYDPSANRFIMSQLGDGISLDATFYWLTEWAGFVKAEPQGGVYGGVGHNDITTCLDALYGSECFWIKRFDATGGFDGASYFFAPNPEFGVSNPCRSVCYAPPRNEWVVGGEAQNLYSSAWNGLWQVTPGWTSITPAPLPGVRGIAYDPTKDCLWVADAVDNALYQVCMDGGPLLGQIPNWGALYGSPRGLCVADTPTHGLVLAATFVNERAPSRFVLFDIDTIVPVERTSWGSIKAMFR